MAPEQVEGKQNEADARTDIFAFGAVVYEMATGRKAFEGKTSASVMAKILEVDPPLMASLQPMTPPALDRVVKRCLAKEPDERWQSANDLTNELKWIAESGSQVMLTPTTASKLSWAVAAGLAVLLGVSLWGWWRSTRPIQQTLRPLVRLDVDLGPDVSLGSSLGAGEV